MSRIGKMPIEIPAKVEISIQGNDITVKGEKGSLSYSFHSAVDVKKEENTIVVSLKDDTQKAFWGTTRALIANMIEGVSNGYTKSLEINGVGYKFEAQGSKLILSIGFSHKVEVEVPAGLKATLDEKQKNVLHITGIDKQRVGQFASKIKAKKKPEPYKGKGIRYVGEYVRRKAGKTGK